MWSAAKIYKAALWVAVASVCFGALMALSVIWDLINVDSATAWRLFCTDGILVGSSIAVMLITHRLRNKG